MKDIILSPISLTELIDIIRNAVKEELKATEKAAEEKLLSPAEACKLFHPAISRVTLSKWTDDGLISKTKIGGRVWYNQKDILEAGSRLKRYRRNNPQ